MSRASRAAEGLAALDAAGLLEQPKAASHSGQGAISDTLSSLGLDQESAGRSLADWPAVRPESPEALARSIAIMSQHRLAALVRGGGSRLDLGNPPAAIDLVLRLDSLSGVTDFDCEDGVVQVRAGTPLTLLREQARVAGWSLPLDPPGATTTVGGTLASGAVGPRVLGHGRPRDCVLGLDVVCGSGERTSCGGRVVKNVTGYDMAKLYTGSCGTLGVIAGAWLRLSPIPELEQEFTVFDSNFENMFALSLEASRRATARVAALLSPAAARRVGAARGAASNWVALLEFAGDELAVRADAGWLSQRAGSLAFEFATRASLPEAPEDGGPQALVDRLRALQGDRFEPGGVRARIAALPTALARLGDRLIGTCPGLVLHPGVGLVYAFSEGGPEAAHLAIEECTSAAANAAGTLVLEVLPPEARPGRDVFGDLGPELSLMRELKRRFDPSGVLNPGRFAGGI